MEVLQDDKTNLRVASFSCYLDHTAKGTSSSSGDHVSNIVRSVDSSANSLISEKFMFSVVPIPPKQLLHPTTFPQQPHKNKLQSALLQRSGSQTSIKSTKKSVGRRILFLGFGSCRGGVPACFNIRKHHHHQEDDLETRSGPTRTRSDDITNMHMEEEEEESRRSIEVFGSAERRSSGDVVAKNMERKLSMLTWDAIPKAKNLPTSTSGSATTIQLCDDMASEASSDLFEIDNINVLMRDHDVLISSPISSSSVYAPSEASIQWSVVTADNCPPPNPDEEEPTAAALDFTEKTSTSTSADAAHQFSFSSPPDLKTLKIRS